MRVCHLSSGTLETHYFANLGKGLAAEGISLLVGSLSRHNSPSWLAAANGARYFSLNSSKRYSYPTAVLRLARLLRRERIDILQTHLFDAAIVGILAARLAATPVVVMTRHHLDQVGLIGSRFHIALDRWSARKADHVVVLSNAVRNYMISTDRLSGDNIEVIYQGFDFDGLSASQADRDKVRAEFNLESNFVIGCVGQFFKTKGHVYLLAALKDLQKEIPNVRLLLLGTGDRAMIEDMARQFAVEDIVVFGGFRKDVAACMAAMDIVVHPSLSEAFCQVLIEAMSVGTALVATDVGGACEVISHADTGLLVAAGDSAAITKSVLELYRDPERRRQLAMAGQQSVRSRFTVDRMVRQQVECYRYWLKNSGSSEKRIHVGSQI
jgi:glycosyltransferase involved in cell wall biosynthesis